MTKTRKKILVIALFCVIVCFVFSLSIFATDVIGNSTYNYSTGYDVDNINGSHFADNLYQIQRYQPESGIDFTFLYSYATDYDALDGSGIQSYIYGVKNFEVFYQYLSRFNYDVFEMHNYLISHYNFFEMDYTFLQLISDTIPTWLDQIDDTRLIGYNQGKSDGYNEGYDIGKSDGYNEGYDIGKSDGTLIGYSEGYQVGKSEGYSSGLDIGYNNGLEDSNALENGIKTIFSAPIYMLTGILDFEILGFSLYKFILSIITIFVIGFIVKSIFGLF